VPTTYITSSAAANIFHQYLIQNRASFASLEVNLMAPSSSSRLLKYIDFNAGIGAVQMLGKANFIALIGGGKQPKFPQNEPALITCPGDHLG
jgi:hypothetical protein